MVLGVIALSAGVGVLIAFPVIRRIVVEEAFVFIVVVLGVIALSAVMGLLIAFPVMWLWNWLMPVLFHSPIIGYWQAYGIYLLCAILFKSSSSRSSKK